MFSRPCGLRFNIFQDISSEEDDGELDKVLFECLLPPLGGCGLPMLN